MKSLSLQAIKEEPKDLLVYPDYLVSCLLRNGIGKIEADFALQQNQVIEFVLSPRFNGQPQVIGRLGIGNFRTVLARFGVLCSVPNLYGSYTLFASDHEHEGQLRTHRFGLFICNEPTMAIWLRLYLYGIDDVWPLRKESA